MNIAILLCAGSGTRMNSSFTKQFIDVNGKPLFTIALETFLNHSDIDRVLLVAKEDEVESIRKITETYFSEKILDVVVGGTYREESVLHALNFLKIKNIDLDSIVLIHDSARPLVSKRTISDNIIACKQFKGALTALKTIDSVVYSAENDFHQMNRDNIYQAQTPQTFYLKDLLEGFKKVNRSFTDDCGVMLAYGIVPHIVLGDKRNFKVTTIEDLDLLHFYLKDY